jgi:hypothetical protein
VQHAIVTHPGSISAIGRLLTAPIVRTAIAPTWALYWNDLVRGAKPSPHQKLAAATTRLVTALSPHGHTQAWLTRAT